MAVNGMGTDEALRFKAEINRRIHDMVEKCYQCGTCTAGCPIADEMDLMPNQIIRLAQLGLKDEALRSRSIWLCASCITCTTRCPQEVEIAAVMEAMRHMAIEQRIAPPREVRHVQTFARAFLRSIRRNGRLFEPGLVMGFNLRSLQPMKDAGKGPTMFLKGKLNVMPRRIKDLGKIRRIFERLVPDV